MLNRMNNPACSACPRIAAILLYGGGGVAGGGAGSTGGGIQGDTGGAEAGRAVSYTHQMCIRDSHRTVRKTLGEEIRIRNQTLAFVAEGHRHKECAGIISQLFA